jgi:hypothetical protein
MKKNLLLIGALCLIVLSATAQERKLIRGKVTDNYKQPIPFASVYVEGTTTGTTTDFDGKFSLKVPPKGTLRISFVGYKTQKIEIGGLIKVKHLELYKSASHKQKDVLQKWKNVKVKLPAKAIGILKDE